MTGNKGQRGTNFIGMTVRHKKRGMCTVINKISNETYAAKMQDLRNTYLAPGEDWNSALGEAVVRAYGMAFTLKTESGDIVLCGRNEFVIPRS